MTFMKKLTNSTAIAAVLAATAMPVMAQTVTEDVTAEDLGVVRAIEGQVAERGDAVTGDQPVDDGPLDMEGSLVAENNFDDAKLDAFIAAAVDLQAVRVAYLEQIAQAPDEASAEFLAQEAQAEMLRVLDEAENITADEYREIGQAAQDDPALATRLTALFEAEMGAAGETEEDKS